MSERIGPVLTRSPIGRAVADAILEQNPEAKIQDRGGYLRVVAPTPCVVSRQSIEDHVGGTFVLPCDLERVMPSFAGTFFVTDEAARWV